MTNTVGSIFILTLISKILAGNLSSSSSSFVMVEAEDQDISDDSFVIVDLHSKELPNTSEGHGVGGQLNLSHTHSTDIEDCDLSEKDQLVKNFNQIIRDYEKLNAELSIINQEEACEPNE